MGSAGAPTGAPPSRVRRKRPRARAVVRLAHLWAGLVLSLVLLVLAVTGSALVYKEAYWRLVHPELRLAQPDPGPEENAAAIAASLAWFGDEVRSVKMPEPGVPAYHLYLADGEAFVSAYDHTVIDRWRPRGRVMPLLFDLHAHLMAGEAGERVGGVVSLLGAVMVATGMYLWWPARRRFSLGRILPRGTSRRHFLPSHRDLGVLAGPLLLVLLLTGGGIVFYGAAGTLLNGLFGDPALPAEPAPALASAEAPNPADAAMLRRVRAELPDARLVFYYPPAAGSGVHGFRLRRPCELHPNGRSYVYLDTSGALLRTVDACGLPPGERSLHALYPLHSGKTESGVYKAAVFAGGLALAMVSFTGAAAYLAKLRA